MYGQSNYATHRGQSANTSRPPLHQWPPPPPRTAQAQRLPMLPHGPPLGPQVGQHGPPTYQHHPFPPFPVPTSGSNSSQFYPMPPPPPPPPQVRGSTLVTLQHSQWNSSMHHTQPVIAPGAPRGLPPPPPLGQTPYRGPVHQSSPDSMQVFLRNLPPPPPLPLPPPPPLPPPNSQNSGFPSPATFDTSTHSRSYDSPVPPEVCGSQPPLPPSPPGDPPLPPSSPPLISSPDNAAVIDKRASENGVIDHCEGLHADKNLMPDLPSPPPEPVAFPQEGSSVQLIDSTYSAPFYSAADSDMEMEDDITRLDEDQQIHSFGAEKQLKDGSTEDILRQNSSSCGPLESEEQRQDSSYRAPTSFQEPSSEANGLIRDNKPVLDDHVQTSSSLEKDVGHLSPLLTDKGVDLENIQSQLLEGASPFRLIQGYSSDDSLDDANESCLEIPGTLTVPFSEVVSTITKTDTGKSLISSVKPSSSVAIDDKGTWATENFVDSIDQSNGNPVRSDAAPEVHQENVMGVDDNDSFDLLTEDVKERSSSQKVDEYGRLVRMGVSDSSDDSPRYTRRHGKRGRSRSRSRSPYDRRRKSPRRRKERRGRSRSISPRRRRSRSKSPSRHGLSYGGEKMRRDRDTSQCFDFLQGRCHRGASCRYFHAEPDKSGRSRSYRSKHQHQDIPPVSKYSDRHNPKESDDTKYTDKSKGHKHDKSEGHDIPDMEVKNMTEYEPTSQYYGRENEVELTASPMVVAEVEKLPGNAIPSSVGTMGIHLSQDHVSDQVLLNADEKLKEKRDLSVSESSSVQTSLMTAPVKHSYQLPQMTRDHNLHPLFNSPHFEGAPPYQAPFPHQQSPFALPLSSSWSSFPPRPAPLQPPLHDSFGSAAGGQQSVPRAPFQPNIVFQRNDYISQASVRPYSSTLLNVPQFGEHHAYAQTQPNYSRGSPSNRPPGELPGPPSKSYPYVQQAPCGLQTSGIPRHVGEPGVSPSVSSYTSELSDRNQVTQLPDFGGSRISSHFNPYASTFEQPLTTKFSSDPLIHGRDMLPSNKYTSFSLSNMPSDGHPAESLGSRNITAPSAHAAEGMLPRTGGNQYDPLYDSIEPSTNSLKMSDPGQKRDITDDSGVMLRLSGSNEQLDVVPHKRQKAASTASAENDEYGETAEAEVGAVENGSPSDSSDGEDVPTGEIEIEQVKSSGAKKKSKGSRSMKLFKIAVADFVKELLKPSWRQGNMSKEVFKTIVKKTVDKVSGAIKSHQVPKSKAKIDHYIDSSQRKLTKLVMGYVDKYVKV